jgi:D-sedoheptulose 7-phosphate isomerase
LHLCSSMGRKKLQQVALWFISDCNDRVVERERIRHVHLLWHISNARRVCRFMNFLERYKADIISAVESIDTDEVIEVIELLKQTRARHGNIFVCGSTGSAATASRVLSHMLMQSVFDQTARFRILALGNGSTESESASEHISKDRLLVEQLKNFAEPGDVVVAISASSDSQCILRALEYGASIGCRTVALTGSDGGKASILADITIHVGSTQADTLEDAHAVICHMIGSYFLDFDLCCSSTAAFPSANINKL